MKHEIDRGTFGRKEWAVAVVLPMVIATAAPVLPVAVRGLPWSDVSGLDSFLLFILASVIASAAIGGAAGLLVWAAATSVATQRIRQTAIWMGAPVSLAVWVLVMMATSGEIMGSLLFLGLITPLPVLVGTQLAASVVVGLQKTGSFSKLSDAQLE